MQKHNQFEIQYFDSIKRPLLDAKMHDDAMIMVLTFVAHFAMAINLVVWDEQVFEWSEKKKRRETEMQ